MRLKAEVSRGNCPPRAETPRLGNYKNPVKTGCAVKNLLEPLAPFMGGGRTQGSSLDIIAEPAQLPASRL
jgi:hypothetical protein